jgi:hypothetical protein
VDERADLEKKVIMACGTCLKRKKALDGEKKAKNEMSLCYCFACQRAAGVDVDGGV